MCFLVVTSAALAQDSTTMTREDQINLAAPTWGGLTGLFTTVTGDTLHRGDLSFGIWYQDFDLVAASAKEFAPPLTARKYKDMGYDQYRASASLGYGLTDRWEASIMMPWERLQNHGNDRAGFINGWLYQGRFTDSGAGDLRVATKIGLTTGSPTKVALSGFVDFPTVRTTAVSRPAMRITASGCISPMASVPSPRRTPSSASATPTRAISASTPICRTRSISTAV